MGVSKTQVVKFIRKGETGNGISSVTEYYLASALSSGVTVSTTGWTTTVQTITATKKYLWNYEVITYSNKSKRKRSMNQLLSLDGFSHIDRNLLNSPSSRK